MDFYAILGLEQGASTADIKRAYRRLARRYHPGINPGDRSAQAMFARISEAYETLVDPERRRVYDRSGTAAVPATSEAPAVQFAEFDFSVAARGSQAGTFAELFAEVLHPIARPDPGQRGPGADVHASVTVGFLSAIRGVERQVMVVRQVTCGACEGRGQTAAHEVRCSECQGRGSVRWARGHMVFAKTCPACGGAGRQRVQRCTACGGHGRTLRSEAVPVRVPAGTPDGTRIRVPERGHAGQNGGAHGDLFVTVHVQPHPFFRRESDDLLCVVPIAVHEAVLGARIDVPGLSGPLALHIPAGTQAGDCFRLHGQGVQGRHGARGDLVVEVSLVLPASVDERSKDLMREFGERNNADVRSGLYSIAAE